MRRPSWHGVSGGTKLGPLFIFKQLIFDETPDKTEQTTVQTLRIEIFIFMAREEWERIEYRDISFPSYF